MKRDGAPAALSSKRIDKVFVGWLLSRCDDPLATEPTGRCVAKGEEDGAEGPLTCYKIEGPKMEAMKHMKGLNSWNRVCMEIPTEE
jgi:hypothetical protein